MKALLGLFLLSLASLSFAGETCTFVIRDRYGYEFETHTRYSSYSKDAACSDANWACSNALSNGRAQGRYYDANCEMKYDGPVNPRPPFPPTAVIMCTTDLVDWYGNTVRSFSGSGNSEWEACRQSEQFCQYELQRGDANGRRCVTRGVGGGNPYPRPPRETTESCSAHRYDPAGFFIQSYNASHTGPIGSDVRGEACRKALNYCSRDIKGRQTCRL